jgi:hypothetical protein
MTGVLITGIDHGLTGALGDGERFTGALRIFDGRITAMGDLRPEPGERVVDATNALVCPGFVNTHHHLFQSLLKAIPAGMDEELDTWLMKVPFTWWPHHDEATFRIAARVGLAELALELAHEVLRPGGALVVKLFHGAGFDAWMAAARPVFGALRIRKPEASRAESREVYAVAEDFQPPART